MKLSTIVIAAAAMFGIAQAQNSTTTENAAVALNRENAVAAGAAGAAVAGALAFLL